MKNKLTGLWMGIILIGLLLEGCGSTIYSVNSEENLTGTQIETSAEGQGEQTEALVQPPESMEVISLKIVDGAEDGKLILAGESTYEVYSLTVDNIPVYLDGKKADASVLEDGMTADISYNGTVMEIFPAMLGDVEGIYVYSRGSGRNQDDGLYDLSGLYLKVLTDLWKTDSALNEDIKYISVDLSRAPGNLTEAEKTAIAWIFSSTHNAEMLTLSYAELDEQGYLEEWRWKDGVLLYIDPAGEEAEKDMHSKVKFEAVKWRSELGAYCFMDCQAKWTKDGVWEDYTVGAHAIS